MIPLLTTTQVAELLAVTPRSVCLWAESGELPGLKVGRQWRFHSAAVEQWLAKKDPAAKKYFPQYRELAEKPGNNGIYG